MAMRPSVVQRGSSLTIRLVRVCGYAVVLWHLNAAFSAVPSLFFASAVSVPHLSSSHSSSSYPLPPVADVTTPLQLHSHADIPSLSSHHASSHRSGQPSNVAATQSLSATCNVTYPIQIRVGVMMRYSGGSGPTAPFVFPGIQVCLEDIRANANMNRLFNITLTFMDDKADPDTAVNLAVELKEQYKVHAIIGPSDTSTAQIVGYLSKAWKMPMISSSASYLFDNRQQYPYVVRVAQRGSNGRMLFDTLEYFGIHKAAIITSNDALSFNFAQTVVTEAAKPGSNVSVLSYQVVEIGKSDFRKELLNIRTSGAATICASMLTPDLKRMLVSAHALGMVDGRHTFFWLIGPTTTESSWLNESNPAGTNEIVYEAAQYLFTWYLATDRTSTYGSFASRVNAILGTPANASLNWLPTTSYEALMVVAHAFEKLLSEENDPNGDFAVKVSANDPSVSTYLVNTILSLDYQSVSGRIHFNKLGAAYYFDVYLLQQNGLVLSRKAVWQDGRGVFPLDGADVMWPNGATHAPPDFIPRVATDVHGRTSIIVVSCVLLVCVAVSVVFLVLYRQAPVVVASSFPVTLLILAGVCGELVLVLLLAQHATNTLCVIRPILGHICCYIIICCLLLKVYRVSRIFSNQKLLRVFSFSNAQIFLRVTIVCIIVSVYLAVWMAVDAPTVNTKPDASHYDKEFAFCQGSTQHWERIILIPEVMLLVFGVGLAFESRSVPSRYNETNLLAANIYNIVVFGGVSALVAMIVDPKQPVSAAVICWAIIICCLTLLCTIMIPKITHINITEGEDFVIGSLSDRESVSFADACTVLGGELVKTLDSCMAEQSKRDALVTYLSSSLARSTSRVQSLVCVHAASDGNALPTSKSHAAFSKRHSSSCASTHHARSSVVVPQQEPLHHSPLHHSP